MNLPSTNFGGDTTRASFIFILTLFGTGSASSLSGGDGLGTAQSRGFGITSDTAGIAEFEKSQTYTSPAQYQAGPNMNANRLRHHAVLLPDGRVALLGGIRENFISLNTAEIFDPATESFTTLTMRHIHDSPSLAKMNDGRYLIAGGSRNWGIPSYDHVEIFDPHDLSFTSTGGMVRFRASGGAAALNDGRVVIASAWWTHNNAHTYGELYDPAVGTFSEIGPFSISRSLAAVIPTTDGKALVVGGRRPTGNWENMPVEQFDPRTGEISTVHEYIIDENEIWSFSNSLGITAQQLLDNGSYLWLAQNRSSGDKIHFKLITINPDSKEVEGVHITPALPDSESFMFLGQPVIDNENDVAYLIARVNDASSYKIAVFTVDLNARTLTQSSNFHSPEGYELRSAPAVLLEDGRIFVSGGSVSDNFDAVNKTLYITPPQPAQIEDGFTLSYTAGEGGSLTGSISQTVEAGQSGTEVTAVPDAGAVFDGWSDGVSTASRMDTRVQANLQVTALFRSEGGVEIDWYAAHGIGPEGAESWADLDSIDWSGKGMTLAEEFIAGTDPNDPQSRYAAALPVVESTGFEIHFEPSRPDRRYSLFRSMDLTNWVAVQDMQNVPGGNGPMVDSDPPDGAAFYRIEVSLP